MPNSCKGRYGRVAVVELETVGGPTPKMISERARGLARIVTTWERMHRGYSDSPNTAFARAVAEAEKMATELNAEWVAAHPTEVLLAEVAR